MGRRRTASGVRRLLRRAVSVSPQVRSHCHQCAAPVKWQGAATAAGSREQAAATACSAEGRQPGRTCSVVSLSSVAREPSGALCLAASRMRERVASFGMLARCASERALETAILLACTSTADIVGLGCGLGCGIEGAEKKCLAGSDSTPVRLTLARPGPLVGLLLLKPCPSACSPQHSRPADLGTTWPSGWPAAPQALLLSLLTSACSAAI